MVGMPDDVMTPRRIADDLVDRTAAQDPLAAAWLGVNPGDERQPDLSPEGFEALADLEREALAALTALPQAVVDDPAERVCARLLRERLTARLRAHECGEHLRALSNFNTPLHDVRNILTLMPTATEADWAAVVGRLRSVPAALDGFRATLTEGISRGLLAAPRQAAVVIDQLTAWTGRDGREPSWFAEFAAPAPEPLRAAADEAAAAATKAFAAFRDWLRAVYAPASEGTPDAVGRERYAMLARWNTGADLDLDEAYEWAWARFHETAAEIRAAATRVLPGADPREAREHLNTEGHVVHGVEAVRAWLQGIMDEAIEALDGAHFDIAGPLRRVESRIAPTGSAAAPYYMGPSLDFSRPGRTFLPTLGRTSFPTWRIVSTWYHEGVPGHHLQRASWMVAGDDLSRYQVTFGKISANVEGWALYAERLMDELGFLTDPGRRLGYLDKQMMRIIRVILDIGMHLRLPIPADSGFHPGERWTPRLGAEFMAAHQGTPAALRDSELLRYLGRPGQAIGYKLGERRWLEGRDAARRRLGPAFDLKTWHMKALSRGSIGLADLADDLAAL
jgi:uncharacterized protein (DUF885 family)